MTAVVSVDAVLPPERFGEEFLTRILHLERVLTSIDRILGDRFALGPMGAGPGRRIATLTASGTFAPCTGHRVDAPELTYRVEVPVHVDFELDLRVDTMRFSADVVLPLTVGLRTVEPLVIVWDIVPSHADEVAIEVTGETRRSAVLQRLAGLDDELRRFLVRYVERELDKPHVRKARRIDLVEVIDGAWDALAAQFLPNGPEDRS